ncbi:MAG: PAS domain S-box protein [Syntrophobacteraceae bacterium]|nr:PAS domain S-box protein [Syntrophobacteraceae bacterium]
MNRKTIIDQGTKAPIRLLALAAAILGAIIPFVRFNWNFLRSARFPGATDLAMPPALLSALISALITAGLLIPIILSVQKRKAMAAQKRLDLLQMITNTIPYPIYCKDINGIYLDCNSGFEIYTGKSKQEIIGRTVYDIAPAELARIYHEADRELLNSPGVKQYEATFRHADGNLRDILFTKHAFSDISGKTAAIVGVMLDISERKNTERVLENSEARLRQIIDLVPHMIFVKDGDGKYLLANRAVAQRYNTTVGELTGKNHADLDPNRNQVERMLQDEREVIRSGKTLFIPEETCSDSEGNSYYLQTTKVPFRTNGGNIEAVLGVAIDITEHKRIEQELRESEEMVRDSEERYRSVLENMQDVFYRTDLNGRITMASPSASKFYEESVEELVGKNIEDFWIYPKERAKMLELIRRDGLVRDYEVSVRDRDGSPVSVAVTSSFRKDREGNILGVDGLIRDITQRKRAEEERALLAKAIEQVAEGIIVTDAKWKIEYANPAFERITGYSGDEIVGMHTRELKSDRHGKSFYRYVRETLSRGETWSGRITNKKKDGSEYDAEVTASAIRDDSGAIRNYISIHRDVTREVQLENQLRQSQKMEALGTLAGGIAHDFNNILGIIMGYTQLGIYDSQSGKPAHTKLEEVLKATHRAKELVQQILAFSRRTEQQKMVLNPGTIVKEAMRILRPSLPSTIEIKTDVASNAAILADPTQMHQVLMNLCTNAAHAMEDAGGVLEVTLADKELDAGPAASQKGLPRGRYVELTVRDSGHGIDPSIIDSIFDPFFTTKEKGKGTGLGLSVVHGVVRSHGGAISVKSAPGKGSSFTVLFPVIQTDCAPKADGEPFTLPCGIERVLVVDDEPVLAEMTQQMLTELGYHAVFRTNGLEALEALRHKPEDRAFELVITDMTMPHFTGVDLARELSALAPEIPIILMTGYSEKIDAEKAKEMGIAGFLLKPVTLKKLAAMARAVLDKKKTS